MTKVEIKKFKPTDAHLKVFIYGASGVGKTTFGTTAPQPLYISAEAGLLSVAEHAPDYIEVKSMAELNAAYEFLSNEKHDYETVIIDSLTEIQNVVMTKITGPDGSPGLSDWGVFSTEMAKILRRFRDLPMHVVFLALENKSEDKDDSGVYYGPQLYGKLADRAAAFMDFVGRMAFYRQKAEGEDKPKAKRGICFYASETQTGKDRSGKLPAFVEPTFKEILAAVGRIQTGKQETVHSMEGEDSISTKSRDDRPHDSAPRRGGGRKTHDLPQAQDDAPIEETTEKPGRPFATRKDVDLFLDRMASAMNAMSEHDLDVIREDMKAFQFSDEFLNELSEYGRMCRKEISKNKKTAGQIAAVPEQVPEDRAELLRTVDETFGTGPKKKLPPKKKTTK